jgi:hypothetical protein
VRLRQEDQEFEAIVKPCLKNKQIELYQIKKFCTAARCLGLLPVIPTILEAEFGRILDRDQPGQMVCKTSSPK